MGARKSKYDCPDGSLPPEDPAAEAFCQHIGVHEMKLQDAYCAARGEPKSDSARVMASRWNRYYAARIEYLRAQRVAAQDAPDTVDTSPQHIATLQREISAALQEASRQAKAFGHVQLSNQIKTSLVRHIGRVQRTEARSDGPVKTDTNDAEVQILARNIRRNFHYCRCKND
jgi:hypothetical protein